MLTNQRTISVTIETQKDLGTQLTEKKRTLHSAKTALMLIDLIVKEIGGGAATKGINDIILNWEQL